jgi:hypothetical protein
VAQLQGGDVGVGLVGDEDLEAVAVGIGEGQLGALVGIFAAADRAGSLRPARKVQGRKLDDLGTRMRLVVRVDLRNRRLAFIRCRRASLQVNADEAGTLRRPPYAWWMRAVVHLGVPCCRASSYSYLPEGTHRVAAEERGG